MRTLCVLALTCLTVPTFAAGDYENGAIAAMLYNQYCDDAAIGDEALGAAVFLAAAEMGLSPDEAIPRLAATAIVQAGNYEKEGQLEAWCYLMTPSIQDIENASQ